ncbi:MAG: DmsE family decaheme c-type cytochrome [Acidobacteriota bacterium]
MSEVKNKRKTKVLVLAVALVSALLLVLYSGENIASASIDDSIFAVQAPAGLFQTDDDNACATCHEKVVADFARTPHGKSPDKWKTGAKNAGEFASSATCTACHGNPTEHINSGGDPTKIKNPGKLPQKESVESCQSCHSQVNEHAQWKGSRHESAGLTCVNCHSPHHAGGNQGSEGGGLLKLGLAPMQAESKLLRFASETATCLSCHSEVRKSMYQRSTHLFRNEDREQRMTCSTCHEPHGSIGDKMMRTPTINETCYTCHAEMRGPFLYDHAPVRESCANCHKPHGSNNVSLLKQRAPMLCQQCHIQGRHQTVPGRPNSAFNMNRSCVNCHSQVHGSNHPSGINLMR